MRGNKQIEWTTQQNHRSAQHGEYCMDTEPIIKLNDCKIKRSEQIGVLLLQLPKE